MEEQINKLKQLDRIEYRIKDTKINGEFNFFMLATLLFEILTFGISIGFIIFFMLEGTLQLYKTPIIVFILGGGIYCLGLGIIGISYYVKNKNKLNKEYFKIEPTGDKR